MIVCTRPRPGAMQGIVLLFVCAICQGCGGPPIARTTFLRSVDLIDMTDRMSASFARSEVLVARDDDEEPWIISLSRVTNHTNQLMPEGERWVYLARLRSSLAQAGIGADRGVGWIIPAEKWSLISEEGDLPEEPFGVRADPTHIMTAEFHTLTRTGPQGRSDTYVCSFQLIDLGDGRIIWEDGWEVKRSMRGLTFD